MCTEFWHFIHMSVMYICMYVCMSPSVTFLFLFLIQTLSSRDLSHSTLNIEQDHLADIWSSFSTKNFLPNIFHFNFSTLVQLVTLVHKWVHCLPIISDKFRIRTDYFGLVIYLYKY